MTTQLKSIDETLTPLFTTKAPFQLPNEWKEAIAKFSPWIMLIFAPISLLAIGLGTMASIFSMFSYNFLGAVSLLLTIVSIIFDLIAIKPLFDRKRSGWTLVFYGWLISLLAAAIQFNIIGIVLSFLIGGYFLYQVKEKFVN